MTRYVFVDPSNAPQGNKTVHAPSYKKACDKFRRQNPRADKFRKGSNVGGKQVFIFYSIS